MCNYLVFVFLLCVMGCAAESNGKDADETNNALVMETPQAPIENPPYPQWLSARFPNRMPMEHRPSISQKVLGFRGVNDSVAYCIVRRMDGVCNRLFLFALTNKSSTDSLEIESFCDHDQSIPQYLWTYYAIEKEAIFHVISVTEKVSESQLDEKGNLAEGVDYDSADKVRDSTLLDVTIRENGGLSIAPLR